MSVTYEVGVGKTYSHPQLAWNAAKLAYGGGFAPSGGIIINIYEGEYADNDSDGRILYMNNFSIPIIFSETDRLLIRNYKTSTRKFSRWILDGKDNSVVECIRIYNLNHITIDGFEFQTGGTSPTKLFYVLGSTDVIIQNCLCFIDGSPGTGYFFFRDSTNVISSSKIVNCSIISDQINNSILQISSSSFPLTIDFNNNVIDSGYDNSANYLFDIGFGMTVNYANNIYNRIGLTVGTGTLNSTGLNQNIDPKLYTKTTLYPTLLSLKSFIDARPLPFSPCISGGVYTESCRFDLNGIPRTINPDIGCFESYEKEKQYTFQWTDSGTVIEEWAEMATSYNKWGDVIPARPRPTLTSGKAYTINCDYEAEEVGTIASSVVVLEVADCSYNPPLPGLFVSTYYSVFPNQKLVIDPGLTLKFGQDVAFSGTMVHSWGTATNNSSSASHIRCSSLKIYDLIGGKGSEVTQTLKNGDFVGWRIKAEITGVGEQQRIIDYIDESTGTIYVTSNFSGTPQSGDPFEIYLQNEHGGEIDASGNSSNKIIFTKNGVYKWSGINFSANCLFDFIEIDYTSYSHFWNYACGKYGSGRYKENGQGIKIKNSYLKYTSGISSCALITLKELRYLIYNCRIENNLKVSGFDGDTYQNIEVVNSWIETLYLSGNDSGAGTLYLTNIRNNIIQNISYDGGAGTPSDDGDVYYDSITNFDTAWNTDRLTLTGRQSFNKNLKSGTSYNWAWVTADRCRDRGYNPDTNKYYVCDILFDIVESGYSGLDVYAGGTNIYNKYWYLDQDAIGGPADSRYRGSETYPILSVSDIVSRTYMIQGTDNITTQFYIYINKSVSYYPKINLTIKCTSTGGVYIGSYNYSKPIITATGDNCIEINSDLRRLVISNLYLKDSNRGIFSNNLSSGFSIIRNCLIENMSIHGILGLYFNIYYCDIIDCTIGYYHNTSGNTSILKNNIFDSNSSYAINGTTGYTPDSDYNLFYNNTINYGKGSASLHDKFGDPLFIKSGDDYYDLQTKSPCIGGAVSVDGINNDILGRVRPMPVGTFPDIGCYEQQFDVPEDDTYIISIIAKGVSNTIEIFT